MSAFTREVLANAVQSGMIRRLAHNTPAYQLNEIQKSTFVMLASLCEQAAKEREDATAAAAGDELERQLGVVS